MTLKEFESRIRDWQRLGRQEGREKALKLMMKDMGTYASKDQIGNFALTWNDAECFVKLKVHIRTAEGTYYKTFHFSLVGDLLFYR